jgi:hypothetical protein
MPGAVVTSDAYSVRSCTAILSSVCGIFIVMLSVFLFSIPVNAQTAKDEISKCAMSIGPDATYLKDFEVRLDGAGADKRPPVFRQSLALRKGVIYRFSVCNLTGSEGQAVLRLYDEANLILSTYYPETGKEYSTVNFQCNKTGAYTIVMSFKDGKPGHAVGVLSYVGK